MVERLEYTMVLLRDKFRDILAEAQKERPNKKNMVNGELEWVTYERTEMYKAVNAIRPMPLEQIEKAEMCACGHADYTSKFALYCAELAIYGKFQCF